MTPTLSSALTRHLRGAGAAGTGMCSTISHGEIWQLNTLGMNDGAQTPFQSSLRSRTAPVQREGVRGHTEASGALHSLCCSL